MLKIILTAILIFMVNQAQAKFEMYLAYQYPSANSQTVSFPNDNFYMYQSKQPFIREDEIISLKPEYDAQLKMALIEIKLSQSAILKFNQLASQNSKYIDQKNFNKVKGLGVIINHVPYKGIQGVHQPLMKNQTRLFWTISDTNISRTEAMMKTQKIIDSFQK